MEDDKATFHFHGTEISSRSSLKEEGDKRLDKLESFLDKLHSKGTVSCISNVSEFLFCFSHKP